MIEFHDRILPADMIGLDQPSEHVEVIIQADHPLASHIRIMIDGRQRAESMVGMVNLSARYLLRYMKDRSVRKISNVLSDPRHIQKTNLLVDEDGNPKIKRVEFQSVIIAVAPTVGVNLIPKPWLPWVVHPALNSRGNQVGSTVLPIFDGDDDDDAQATQPSSRDSEFFRELQRRVEEMRDASAQQRTYGGPPLSISGIQEEYERYLASRSSSRNAQASGGGLAGGLLGGSLADPQHPSRPATIGARMRQALDEAESGGDRTRTILLSARQMGSRAHTIRDMHGNTLQFGPQGSQGTVGPAGLTDHTPIVSAMRTMELLESDIRQMNEEFNDAEPFHVHRLDVARGEVSDMRSVWGLESSFTPTGPESDPGGEPARQFGIADGINLGDVVRGPGGVPIGIVTGETIESHAGGMSTHHVQIRNGQGEFRVASDMINRNGDGISLEMTERLRREIQNMVMPQAVIDTIMAHSQGVASSSMSQSSSSSSSGSSSSSARRNYVTGDQVDWTLINLQLFDTLSQIWLHLDTWASSLTPVTSIRRFGEIGQVMESHASRLTTRNWTERCREMTGALNRFSSFVRTILHSLSASTGNDMDCPMCTPEAFSIREGLLQVVNGSQASIPECRRVVYSYLHRCFLESEERTAVRPANRTEEHDVQREWEAQVPIHAEDEDDFPF